MRCASCGFENPAGTKFCGECGKSLTYRCPSCGVDNPPQFKFCGECGASRQGAGQFTPAKSRKRTGATKARKATHPATSPTAAKAGPTAPEAERRQLTVMFCDLVGSTALSEQLDPEELREVVRAYQATCTTVIERYDGYIAQYLGDGLLVYFGYPAAHEDDAQRAVRTGLGIVAALGTLNAQLPSPLQVRIGIHTGPVVVGDIGAGMKREQLAVGETPNIAARLQGLAEPDTVVISAATQRLTASFFDYHDMGQQTVKSVSVPLQVYRVLSESSAQSRLEIEATTGKLTPLVGRAHEVGLVLERWTAAQAGDGQVVLVTGEPGIGKSRLVQEVKEHVVQQGATCLEFRCSPYAQNSAFAPVLVHLERLLHWQREDTPQAKLDKLRQTLARYHFPQADTLPLLAALLSLPHPVDVPPLTLSPQKQKQKTQEALVAWLVEEAERQAVYCVWEDLHWADPSTVDLLGLLLDQVPTTRLLVLLTARPEFTPSWSSRTHLTPLPLARLPRTQAGEMIERVTGGKPLPADVQQQIVSKTDGVPLFVEELTKMVLESRLLRETNGHYELVGPLPPLAIPSTLQDSLMARLDRLARVRELAQLGATLGREFSYEVLHAVSPLDEGSLQQGLRQLIEAELLYQRGVPPQATYLFKHALVQDTAYQSLLKSKRQQLHRQIAQVVERRFPETVETHPELLAYHYTEAGLREQALPYWQQAGQRANQRAAYREAISQLSTGLKLLQDLPDTPRCRQQELAFQLNLGASLIATKGYSAPEVGQAHVRAQELCRQGGDTSQLFPALWGLWAFYLVRAEHQTAWQCAQEVLTVAKGHSDPVFLPEGNLAPGISSFCLGNFVRARQYLETGLACYNPQRPTSQAFLQAPGLEGVSCLSYMARTLWALGYVDQAREKIQEALTLAEDSSHPFSLVYALNYKLMLHQLRRETGLTHDTAETLIKICTEHGFSFYLSQANILKGWALAEQGEVEEGIRLIREGVGARRAAGGHTHEPYFLELLAEVHEKANQIEEGLGALNEAITIVQQTEEREAEAELHRLKGRLTLKKFAMQERDAKGEEEAEAYFQKASEIAQSQKAKSWELRAAISLARLWQQQGKQAKARQQLAEIYGWFTEGFDTKDLLEAKALLVELH